MPRTSRASHRHGQEPDAEDHDPRRQADGADHPADGGGDRREEPRGRRRPPAGRHPHPRCAARREAGRRAGAPAAAMKPAPPSRPVRWTRKDLLGIAELSAPEIELILDTAESFREVGERPIKKVPTLRGKTVMNLFFEASTRTRSSFEIAEKRLSADNINFSTSGSSLEKGETLVDTALNLQAMAPDLVIIRHAHPGVPHMLASRIKAGVINAGDGAHEHPTQALLDAYTIRRHKKEIAGLKVAILGDIEHSRVVRSNIHLLRKLGAKVTVGGPRTLMPVAMETMGVEVAYDLDDAIRGADVIMMLRIQLERQGRMSFPSVP